MGKMRKGLLWIAAVCSGLLILGKMKEVSSPAVLTETPSAGSAQAGTIALTFDDGPHPVYTPRLLEGLRERGVHVTFFLIGQNIDGNEEIIRQMKEDGHLIGNHSQNHMQLTKEQTKEACDQISRTNEKIKEKIGRASCRERV